MLILLVLGFGLVVFRETPALIRNKYWKDLIVFGVLMIVAFIVSVLMILGIDLPQVSTAINDYLVDLVP